MFLRFDYGMAFRATAEAADGRWEFSRRGWFTRRVTVRRSGKREILATMTLSGERAGVLERPEGRGELTALRWSFCGTWDTEEDWVIRYHNTSEFHTHQARVEVDRRLAHLPELLLLITLGWYLEVLRIRDPRTD